jgi:hypothetical protein
MDWVYGEESYYLFDLFKEVNYNLRLSSKTKRKISPPRFKRWQRRF